MLSGKLFLATGDLILFEHSQAKLSQFDMLNQID